MLNGHVIHYTFDAPVAEGPIHAADPPYDKLYPGVHECCVICVHPAFIFDIMRSNTASPLTAIAHTPTTLLMNFIGTDYLSIAYPWTFDDNTGIITSRGNDVAAVIQ